MTHKIKYAGIHAKINGTMRFFCNTMLCPLAQNKPTFSETHGLYCTIRMKKVRLKIIENSNKNTF